MKNQNLESRLDELMLRKSELEKELEDRTNMENGIFVVDSPRPIPLRSSKSIRRDLKKVIDEIENIEHAIGADSGEPANKLPKGDLKEIVRNWAEAEKFPVGKTVPAPKIAKFVREQGRSGVKITTDSVRATLSRLGYTKEKDKDET